MFQWFWERSVSCAQLRLFWPTPLCCLKKPSMPSHPQVTPKSSERFFLFYFLYINLLRKKKHIYYSCKMYGNIAVSSVNPQIFREIKKNATLNCWGGGSLWMKLLFICFVFCRRTEMMQWLTTFTFSRWQSSKYFIVSWYFRFKKQQKCVLCNYEKIFKGKYWVNVVFTMKAFFYHEMLLE